MYTSFSKPDALSFRSSFYDNFFQKLPNKTIENSKKFNRTGMMLASPHWNRVAIGCVALSTQPWIDYFNPDVNRDTAKVSTCRTIAKGLVCPTVGFIVRGGVYKLVEKYAHASEKEGSTLLTPKAILNEKNLDLRKSKLKLHKNAFSTVSALVVMLFTNVLIDAPAVTKTTNKFIDIMRSYEKRGEKHESS